MSKRIITITVGLLSLLLLVGGATYAFYEWVSDTNTNTNISFDVEGLRIRYEGGTDITGVNLIPTNTKEEGVLKEVEVELDSNQVITPAPSLSLFLDLTLFPSDLADASFKWEVYRNDETTAVGEGNFSGRQQGDSIELITNQSITSTKDTYKIYLWIDGNEENNSNMQNQTFTFTLHATGANSILGIYYELEGIIYKEDGSVCSLCDVTMHSDPIQTTTTADGYYYFEEIPVGRHTLIVEDEGTEIINDKFILRKNDTSSITDKEVTLNNNTALIFKGGESKAISEIRIQDQDTLIVRKSDTFNYFQGTNLDIKELFDIDLVVTNGGTTICTENATTITNISSLSNGSHTVRCTATTQTGSNQISSVTINIDNVTPTISTKQPSNNLITGTSKQVTDFFNMNEYSYTNGVTECKINNNIITNINTLGNGSYNLNCTMTTGSGKTASASTTINLDNLTPTISSKQGTNNLTTGTSVEPITLFNVNEFSYTGGTTTCTANGTTITNISTLANGNYTLSCTRTTGNNKTASASTTLNLDNLTPSISAKASTNVEVEGTNKAITEFFNIGSYSYTGGLTVCKVGNEILTNISSLNIGTYTISCTMTTGAEKVSTASSTLRIKSSLPQLNDKIVSLATTNTNELITITQPATTQVNHQTTEYRYYGKNPNNYVYYNCLDSDTSGNDYGTTNYNYTASCELWRIIGVFETETPIYNGNTISGYVTENRVKIIRKDYLVETGWDDTESNINRGYGINAWESADLMNFLNYDSYWNRTGNFNTTGLSTTAKNLIEPAKYYLGGIDSANAKSSDLYKRERGDITKICLTTGPYREHCNDGLGREMYWTGHVGLMYPSDYGYAAGSTCAANTVLTSYSASCKNTDWLLDSSADQWTISQVSSTSYGCNVVSLNWDGVFNLNTFGANYSRVRPVVHLSSEILFKSGTGTTTSPFIIIK